MQTENLNIEVNSDNKLSATLKEKLQNLPLTPGVYQFKDINGKVLYVGKAKLLRNRVRQYFQSKPQSGILNVMISKIADLEMISTDNEVEALILEQNLIKSLKPRYNINLKDDKSYPYIVITNEQFPASISNQNKAFRRFKIFRTLYRCKEYAVCS
ncbi:MAG: GIY-YIG nuclease family protein [Ignavibacteria bacterium]|nr:GIY-YIG nuclease family protein [Ignavibacteria bacterium]